MLNDDAGTSDIPVVICTSKTLTASEGRQLRENAVAVVSKNPRSADELRRSIRKAVGAAGSARRPEESIRMPDRGAVVSVLNVNDDPANLYAVSRMLRAGGFEVVEAVTGREALQKARSRPPDLVVLDVNLPDTSGLEVCRQLKASSETAAIPILQVSAISVRTADRVQGLDSGADGYLTMPVEPEELIASVRALLRAKRAEEAVHQAGVEWRRTVDAIADAVCLLDDQFIVVRCNAAFAAFGRLESSDAAAGRPVAELLKENAGSSADAIIELLDPSRRRSVELPIADRWYRVSVDPLRGADGAGSCVLMLTDLTVHRRLEQELRQSVLSLAESDRRKNEFLAMLSHELRNPLAAVATALHSIRNCTSADEECSWTHEVAVRQVSHLTRLVDDLLDLSRITHGKIELRKETSDLKLIVERAISTARPAVDHRKHTLHFDLPKEAVAMYVDPIRIEQAIINLLQNSAKYTPEGGEIRISASATKDKATIVVSDTGQGISSELMERIFDPFAQGFQPLDRPDSGLGVGLTLVKSIAELHGGEILARSAGENRGSEFVITIPRRVDDVAIRNDATEAVAGPNRRLRVLIAEDNDDVRNLLRIVVSRGGHEVDAVADGAAAVEAVHERHYDVALLDLGLPLLDGYEAAKQIRDYEGVRQMRIIAVSGYGRAEDRARSREAGFDLHLVKPVAPQVILSSLES